MNVASAALLGEQDFAAFCKKREGATTIRSLLDLHWDRDGDGPRVATVRADAFCHNMVRALVGCLLAVGDGRRRARVGGRRCWRRGERDPAVTVLRAHGLTLEEVALPARRRAGGARPGVAGDADAQPACGRVTRDQPAGLDLVAAGPPGTGGEEAPSQRTLDPHVRRRGRDRRGGALGPLGPAGHVDHVDDALGAPRSGGRSTTTRRVTSRSPLGRSRDVGRGADAAHERHGVDVAGVDCRS